MGRHKNPKTRAKKTQANQAGHTSKVAGVSFRDDGKPHWLVRFRHKGKDYLPRAVYPVDLAETNPRSDVHVDKARLDAEAYALKEAASFMAHQRPMASFGANWTLQALLERVIKDFDDGQIVLSSGSIYSALKVWVGKGQKGHNKAGFPSITGKRLTELKYKDFFNLDGSKAFNKLLKDRSGKPASNSSVKKMLKAVQFAFKRAKEEYEIEFDNPLATLRGIEAQDARSRTLTEDEFESILSVLRESRVSFATVANIVFIRYTAVRRGESTKLNWPDIDFKNKTAHLKGTKSKRGGYRERVIPVPKQAMDVLHKLYEATEDKQGPVFAHEHNDEWTRLGADTPTQAWDRARKKVAKDRNDPTILSARLHDLRHTRITEIGSMPDITMAEAAAISGHTDMRTFMRYFNPKPETIGVKLDAYESKMLTKNESSTIDEAIASLIALNDKDAVCVAFGKAMEHLTQK